MLAFIEDYRSFTVLWDVNHKDYTNKMKRNNVLNALVTDYKMGVKEVKNKIKSLRSYFGKEQQMWQKKKSGAGVDDVYDSPWLAYKITNVHIDRRYFSPFFLTFFKITNVAFILANIAASDISIEFTVYTCYKLNDYWRTSEDRLRHASMACAKRHTLDERSVETWKRKRKLKAHKCGHSKWSASWNVHMCDHSNSTQPAGLCMCAITVVPEHFNRACTFVLTCLPWLCLFLFFSYFYTIT